MKKSKKWIWILICIVVLAGIFAGTKIFRKPVTSEQTKEIKAFYGDIQTFISTTGNVQPQNRVEIRPPVNGRVENILVNEGDKVTKGEVLAWMSSTDRAVLLDSAMSQGQEVLKKWQDVYKATPLMSPINGEVISRPIEPGQSVTTGTAVLVVSDRLIVKAQVDETDIGKVKVGQEAKITLDAYPDVKVPATVNHISYESTLVNNVTIYTVDILPDTVPDVFRSGMSANISILDQGRKNVLLVPQEAVTQDKTGNYVMVSTGQGQPLRKQQIETGLSDTKNLEVLSGITIDDRLIIKVQDFDLSGKKTQQASNPFMPKMPGRSSGVPRR